MANSILLSETFYIKNIYFQSTVESSEVRGYRQLPWVCTGVNGHTHVCR